MIDGNRLPNRQPIFCRRVTSGEDAHMVDQSLFIFGRACHEPELMRLYQALIEIVLQTEERRNIWRPTTLLTENALIGTLIAKNKSKAALAGLHVVFDRAGTAIIQGVVTDPDARRCGLAFKVISNTLRCLASDFGSNIAELKLRLDHEGKPYLPAYHLYLKLGFRDICDIPVKYASDNADEHLREYALSPDTLFNARLMRVNLADWHIVPCVFGPHWNGGSIIGPQGDSKNAEHG
jgi:GNAT superfamily N-acetyltransferase